MTSLNSYWRFQQQNSTVSDFAGNDEKLQLFASNNIIERQNQDCHTNNLDHMLINICKMTDLKIFNGRIGMDQIAGKFTYHASNGNRVIYYAVASTKLFPYITDFYVAYVVFDRTISDLHCAITLNLSRNMNETKCSTSNEIVLENSRYIKNSTIQCRSTVLNLFMYSPPFQT